MKKSVLKDWSDTLATIDKNINPELGENFSIKKCIDGNTQERKNIKFTTNNAAVYIGRIPKDRDEKKESIYNKDAIKRMFQQLLLKIEPNEQLTVFDATDISQSINQITKQDSLDHMQVKEFLSDIADDSTNNGSTKIKVMRYSDQHPRLFEDLQIKGTEYFLHIDEQPELLNEALSWELFTFLARLVQQPEGKEIAQQAEWALPKQLKQKAKDDGLLPTYRLYALCEIACRMRDLMNGRYIQWGVERQVLYDRIITYIVKWSFRTGSPLHILQQYICTSPHVQSFTWFYYNDKISCQNEEKLQKKRNVMKRVRNIAAITIFSLAAVFVYKSIDTYISKIKLHNANEKLLWELTKNEYIVQYLDPTDHLHEEFQGEKLKKLIRNDVKTIIKHYMIRFGILWKMTEEDFAWRILDNLTTEDLKKIHEYGSEKGRKINEFIDNKLIHNSQFSFLISKVPTHAYPWLADKEENMINTLRTGEIWKQKHSEWWYAGISEEVPLTYISYDWWEADIVRNTAWNYFTAKSTYDWMIDSALTQRVIIDYFIQTRPGYKKMADILETYMRHSREYIYQNKEDSKRENEDKWEFIKYLVLHHIDGLTTNSIESIRLLKKIFVEWSLWQEFIQKFQRYNMFGGEFINDTTIIENTREKVLFVSPTPSHFERIWRYPYIWYMSNDKLIFYAVTKTTTEGKEIYIARKENWESIYRSAGDALDVYTFLHEDIDKK